MFNLNFKQRLYQRYWQFVSNYLDKRQPAGSTVTLVQKLIFILPTRYGWWFFLLIILMYLLGTNYQNNLILLLCYLLLSVFLLSITMCYLNMSGLTLSTAKPAEGFVNSDIEPEILTSSAKQHMMLQFSLVQHSQLINMPQLERSVRFSFTGKERGRFALPRIKISSQYPFGLWRAWSYIALDQIYWVYPTRMAQITKDNDVDIDDKPQSTVQSGDTLTPYRPGDSIRHMVWKRLARDPFNPVVRQQLTSPQAAPNWVVVPALTGEALERALRQACQQLLTLEQTGKRYGLQLPHQTLPQSSGSTHLQRCLQELALC